MLHTQNIHVMYMYIKSRLTELSLFIVLNSVNVSASVCDCVDRDNTGMKAFLIDNHTKILHSAGYY